LEVELLEGAFELLEHLLLLLDLLLQDEVLVVVAVLRDALRL